jgi:DNA-binding transcriptional LysR family regulator
LRGPHGRAKCDDRRPLKPSTMPIGNHFDALGASRLEIRHLRYFLAVAEEGNFGRGAKRVHVAQPAISRQIRQLEEELGVQLFRRLQPKVQLTGAGHCFLEKTRSFLKNLELAVEEIRQISRLNIGRIRVGYVDMAFYSGDLPEKIRQFQNQNPGIDIELVPHTSVEQIELLQTGSIDLGLVYQEPSPSHNLNSRKLSSEPLTVAVHHSNGLARRSSVSLSELRDQSFVWFDRAQNPALFDYVDEVCQGSGLRRRIIQNGTNDPAQLALVAALVGITFSPVSANSAKPANVCLIPLRDRPLHISLYAAWRKDDLISPAARSLLQALVQ